MLTPKGLGACAMAQLANPLPCNCLHPIWASVCVLTVSLLIQLLHISRNLDQKWSGQELAPTWVAIP